MKNQIKLTAEPGRQELFVVREFEAPRELVFKAFTDPDIMVQWLGPKNMSMIMDYYVAGNGGRYRYVSTDPKGNTYAFHGVIHEVSAPERVIQTFEFEGMAERGHVILDTAMFDELPGDRTRLTIQSVFRSVEDRDGMVKSGMEYGLREGFEKLDELLTN